MPSHPGVTSATANAVGSAQLIIEHDKSGIKWVIAQMSVKTVPPGPLNVEVLYNAFPLMTPTPMNSGATADGEPTIDILDHDKIYVNVTKATPGCQITLAFYYDEVSSGMVG